MAIEVCSILAQNCIPDWDGVSAIATTAATATALLLPPWQRKKDKQERESALAQSILMKMVKIHSDIFHLNEYVTECKLLATQSGEATISWRYFRSLASLPTNVSFSSDELSLVFSLKNDNLFNSILSMDEVHAADISTMRTYQQKREAIVDMLPGGIMNGPTGTITLNKEQFLKINPYAVQLDMLCIDIEKTLKDHYETTEKALVDLHKTLVDKKKIKIKLVLPKERKKEPINL